MTMSPLLRKKNIGNYLSEVRKVFIYALFLTCQFDLKIQKRTQIKKQINVNSIKFNFRTKMLTKNKEERQIAVQNETEIKQTT